MQQHRGSVQPLEVAGSIVRYALEGNEEILVSEADSEHTHRNTSTSAEDAKGLGDGSTDYSSRATLWVLSTFRAAKTVSPKPDLDLLASVASQAGLAMASAQMRSELRDRQRLERDLMLARQIQRSLLPASPPDVVGLEFAVPLRTRLPNRWRLFTISSGTTIRTWRSLLAMLRARRSAPLSTWPDSRANLRSRAAIARTPARLLRKVNQEMLALGDDGMFATLAYAIYDLETRTTRFHKRRACGADSSSATNESTRFTPNGLTSQPSVSFRKSKSAKLGYNCTRAT